MSTSSIPGALSTLQSQLRHPSLSADISNYPVLEEVLDVRDMVETVATTVDAFLSEVLAESRYMANVGVATKVTPLADWLRDQGILEAFTRAAVELPRRHPHDKSRSQREAA